MKFANFLRTPPFLRNTFGDCFRKGSLKELAKQKSCSPVILIYLESITHTSEGFPSRQIWKTAIVAMFIVSLVMFCDLLHILLCEKCPYLKFFLFSRIWTNYGEMLKIRTRKTPNMNLNKCPFVNCILLLTHVRYVTT